MFNMNCYAFYRKYMKDLYLLQIRENGVPPLWCPEFMSCEEIARFLPADGMIAWSDAATIIPWNVYLMTGKEQILHEQYDGMKKWVDIMSENINKDGLYNINQQQFCDSTGTVGGTENTFICTTYYYISLTLTYKAAKILGKNEDYEKYHNLAVKTLANIRDEYFAPRGRCAIQTQTSLSLAIIYDLQPEGKMDVSLGSLYELLYNNDYHLSTGFIGTQILCRAFSKAGDNYDAVKTFLQKDYPGWLYPVTQGATSMWERWNSLQPGGSLKSHGINSFNHYAYGSICEWIYCDLCGLNPIEEFPGLKKVLLRPNPDRRLINAKASYESSMGHFECGWIVEYYKVKYAFSVPFNVEAKLILLNLKKNEISSSNFETREEGNDVIAELTHGDYVIIYKPSNYFIKSKFV